MTENTFYFSNAKGQKAILHFPDQEVIVMINIDGNIYRCGVKDAFKLLKDNAYTMD